MKGNIEIIFHILRKYNGQAVDRWYNQLVNVITCWPTVELYDRLKVVLADNLNLYYKG